MADIFEVLLTSDESTNLWSACTWDYNAGNCLHYYKSAGIITPHTLAFLRDEYVIAAERSKPLLHIWKINSQEPLKNVRVVCSGPVSAIAVSPDGNYCAGAIAERLNIWQIATGRLVATVAKHFQPITKLNYTSDGSHIISAGEDGMILVWSCYQLLSQTLSSDQIKPLHVLSDHSLPVRDLCVGSGLNDANVISVSIDSTLKIHKIVSGELLLSVVFDKSLTSVAMDNTETFIYVGKMNGVIHEFSLLNPPRNKVYHSDVASDAAKVFSGHTKSISALSVSLDGLTLASGSLDNQVILWHIPTKQKLRILNHNGPVTNVLFTTAFKNMFANEFKPSLIFNAFQRNITEESDTKVIEVIHQESIKLPFEESISVVSHSTDLPVETNPSPAVNLQDEVDKLKIINNQLYKFSLNMILKNASTKVSASEKDNIEEEQTSLEHLVNGDKLKKKKRKYSK